MSGVRAATPIDIRRVGGFLDEALRSRDAIIGSTLPTPLAAGAIAGPLHLVPGLLGLRRRLRVYVEEQADRVRSAALVYEGRRAEWFVLVLAAHDEPGGPDGAFRLLSSLAAAAARRGMQRLYATVPDGESGASRTRETFFQAGFYSYTRETWYVGARLGVAAGTAPSSARPAVGSDAHDLFRFYAATTPDAVQRAEQLTMEDFDVRRRAGAFDPPHIAGGNPLAMRRHMTMIDGDELRARAFAVSFRGSDHHPHVCKVRTEAAEVDLARELIRATTHDLPPNRPVAAPVRSYEEHVARALLAEGFQEAATAMLFVKELAVRIEEPLLAPAVVR
ncbi:MAG: hypothetical protein M3O91_10120 [Chloroflexota bacterium]|nr:hypothetical protein [Chloroflexota bacterium]